MTSFGAFSVVVHQFFAWNWSIHYFFDLLELYPLMLLILAAWDPIYRVIRLINPITIPWCSTALISGISNFVMFSDPYEWYLAVIFSQKKRTDYEGYYRQFGLRITDWSTILLFDFVDQIARRRRKNWLCTCTGCDFVKENASLRDQFVRIFACGASASKPFGPSCPKSASDGYPDQN